MRIFVTGGTGFIGGRLVPYLLDQGHELVVLARKGETAPEPREKLDVLIGDPTEPGPWWDAVAECDAAVNMAGTPILGKWTTATKQSIRQSRIATTKNLVDAIQAMADDTPFTLFSTSAVGIYGDGGEETLSEDSAPGSDFLATVACEWEAQANKATRPGVRVVIGRFAMVLGPDGGALTELVHNARTLRGGPVGGGRQWVSWIHREDLVRAIAYLLGDAGAQGVYNLSSPQPVRQKEMAQTLGRLLKTPSFVPAPALAVRMILGEMADVVLFSQRMESQRIQSAGFTFDHPALGEALHDILADQLA
jgi:uncharacterized protein (TIGR01777 family)